MLIRRAAIKTIEDKNFEEIVNSNKLVFIYFWATWCGPCRVLSPVIESLAEEYEGRVTVGKVNIDENPETTHRWSVRSIPTIMMFVDGKMVEVVNGLMGREYLANLIDKNL